MITFDEEKHEYRFAGRIVPSVTQILDGNGLVDKEWFTEESRQRGNAIHLATQYHDEGRLDHSTLHEEVAPRVTAWQKFKHDTGFKSLLIEHIVYNPGFNYAGKLDRIMGRDNDRIILDIKSGKPSKATKLQLAGYVLALGPEYTDLYSRRYALELRENGKYDLIPYKDLDDFADFKAAVRMYHWRAKHNLLNN